jgi:hypothetical protein
VRRRFVSAGRAGLEDPGVNIADERLSWRIHQQRLQMFQIPDIAHHHKRGLLSKSGAVANGY